MNNREKNWRFQLIVLTFTQNFCKRHQMGVASLNVTSVLSIDSTAKEKQGISQNDNATCVVSEVLPFG